MRTSLLLMTVLLAGCSTTPDTQALVSSHCQQQLDDVRAQPPGGGRYSQQQADVARGLISSDCRDELNTKGVRR